MVIFRVKYALFRKRARNGGVHAESSGTFFRIPKLPKSVAGSSKLIREMRDERRQTNIKG